MGTIFDFNITDDDSLERHVIGLRIDQFETAWLWSIQDLLNFIVKLKLRLGQNLDEFHQIYAYWMKNTFKIFQ